MPRPEQSRAARKAARGKHLLTRYGLTAEQYDKLYETQEGLCPFCGRAGENLEGQTPMVVDHDHRSFKVRGLLHPRCNKLLTERLEQYLLDPPGRVLDHTIPVWREASETARVDRKRAAKEYAKRGEVWGGEKETPGERQTYRYPDRPNLVDQAMRELEGVTVA